MILAWLSHFNDEYSRDQFDNTFWDSIFGNIVYTDIFFC